MNPHNSLRPVLSALLVFIAIAACATSTAIPGPTVVPSTVTTQPTSSPRAPEEVLGSVLIEQGRSAIGGTAGTTIEAEVDLWATSTVGKVTDMRVIPVSGCDSANQVDGAAWEPFAPKKSLPVAVALNWTGFYVAAQFRDDHGNASPAYCDDISVEGMPAVPQVNPSDWYPQIHCFSESDVHPSGGETVTGPTVTFTWPAANDLPDGVFYQVNAYGASDQYTAVIASGRTRDTSLTLQPSPDRAGDVVWYIVLVDANGTLLDHGRCSSFPASLLTVDPPQGIKGVHFLYQP